MSETFKVPEPLITLHAEKYLAVGWAARAQRNDVMAEARQRLQQGDCTQEEYKAAVAEASEACRAVIDTAWAEYIAADAEYIAKEESSFETSP